MNNDNFEPRSTDQDDWLEVGLIVVAAISIVAFSLLVAMEKMP